MGAGNHAAEQHHALRERLAIVEHRQEAFERAITDIRDNLIKLTANLEIITRIDERQAAQSQALERTFKRMDSHSRRLKNLEEVVPMNSVARMTGSKLFIGLILLGCSLVGGAISQLVLP